MSWGPRGEPSTLPRNGTFSPPTPPRQGVALPLPFPIAWSTQAALHLRFPQVVRGDGRRREGKRRARSLLHPHHAPGPTRGLDTRNVYPRTVLPMLQKENSSWGTQGQGLLHPITFTQKYAAVTLACRFTHSWLWVVLHIAKVLCFRCSAWAFSLWKWDWANQVNELLPVWS